MKTRQQAAEEFFPFQNPDKEIQCISINDIAKECHASFLAGCEFEAQNNPKVWVLYAGFWYEVDYFSREFSVQWVHIYDEPPSLHSDCIKLSSIEGITISSERPPKPQEL